MCAVFNATTINTANGNEYVKIYGILFLRKAMGAPS